MSNIDPKTLRTRFLFQTDRAAVLAQQAHKGQTRKNGENYFNHVTRVAVRAKKRPAPAPAINQTRWEELVETTALLHDVIEDTNVTLLDLGDAGFGLAVREAVSLLTHKDGQGYNHYLACLSTNLIARAVKIADLLDNLTDNASPRQIERYSAALNFLIKIELGQ